MAFELAPLPYALSALEPHIDARTMEIHHGKHHNAYVTNLNNAIKDTEMANASLEDLVKNAGKHPVAVRNNGGGHWNHTFFWGILKKNENGKPSGTLAQDIDATFGSYDKFKEEFAKAATGRFGSGWAWLIVNDGGKLEITSTPNQDNPLMDVAEKKGTPILGLDVWEHAYYLNYQNRRPDYVAAFWHVIDWGKVGQLYAAAKK
jgi:superoxide dismutase, Fe-Mn family